MTATELRRNSFRCALVVLLVIGVSRSASECEYDENDEFQWEGVFQADGVAVGFANRGVGLFGTAVLNVTADVDVDGLIWGRLHFSASNGLSESAEWVATVGTANYYVIGESFSGSGLYDGTTFIRLRTPTANCIVAQQLGTGESRPNNPWAFKAVFHREGSNDDCQGLEENSPSLTGEWGGRFALTTAHLSGFSPAGRFHMTFDMQEAKYNLYFGSASSEDAGYVTILGGGSSQLFVGVSSVARNGDTVLDLQYTNLGSPAQYGRSTVQVRSTSCIHVHYTAIRDQGIGGTSLIGALARNQDDDGGCVLQAGLNSDGDRVFNGEGQLGVADSQRNGFDVQISDFSFDDDFNGLISASYVYSQEGETDKVVRIVGSVAVDGRIFAVASPDCSNDDAVRCDDFNNYVEMQYLDTACFSFQSTLLQESGQSSAFRSILVTPDDDESEPIIVIDDDDDGSSSSSSSSDDDDDDGCLSSGQSWAIIICRVVEASITFILCLFAMIYMILSKKLHQLSSRLIFKLLFYAWCDSFNNFFIPGSQYNAGICYFQALLQQIFQIAVFMQIFVIALHIFLTTVIRPARRLNEVRPGVLEITYDVIVLSWTAVCVIVPLSTNSYGLAGSWCWIKDEGIGTAWRFAFFYVQPLFVVLILMILMYGVVMVRIMIWHFRGKLNKSFSKVLYINLRLALFPIAFLVIWFFPVVNRIYNWAAAGDCIFVLTLLHGISEPIQGAVYATIYLFLNKDVRYTLTCRRSKLQQKDIGSASDSIPRNFSRLFTDPFVTCLWRVERSDAIQDEDSMD